MTVCARHEDDPQGMAGRLASQQVLRAEETVAVNQVNI